MKHIHTFESFLNEGKKSSDVITLKKFTGKDHNNLWSWMQKEFGPTKYSPGIQRVAGPLTHGGDFTLDISAWDKKDVEALKAYLSSQNHVYEEFLWDQIWEADDDEQKSTDRGPLDSEELEKGVKNKAKESGCPVGIIRTVFRRGMAAWKSGHRPGAGQEQWAYARVNSFLTGGEGTWGKADADLAKEARAAGFNPKK